MNTPTDQPISATPPAPNPRVIFPRSVEIAAFAGIFLYPAVTWYFELEWFGLARSLPEWIAISMLELVAFWLVGLSTLGWMLAFRWRKTGYTTRPSVMCNVPIALCSVFAGYLVWDARASSSLSVGYCILLGGGSLLPGILVAWLLRFQMRRWRQLGDRNTCPVCRYSLVGNESGTCPECGAFIESDRTVHLSFYKKRFYWLPELGEFKTAGERRDVMRIMNRLEWRNLKKRWFVACFLVVVGGGVFSMVESSTWSDDHALAMQAVLTIGVVALVTYIRASTRRRLRTLLEFKNSTEKADESKPTNPKHPRSSRKR